MWRYLKRKPWIVTQDRSHVYGRDMLTSELTNFFRHINQVDANIKFTQEEATDNQLPFLDCLIKVEDSGTLSSRVYRKPTHTDHYLQFGSHHPLIHKLGVIRTLFY